MKKKIVAILAILLAVGSIPTMPTKTAKAAEHSIQFITEAVYSEIGNYSEGLFWVNEDGVYKYIDDRGKVVIDFSNKEYVDDNHYVGQVGDFNDGLALISVYQNQGEDDAEYIEPDQYLIDKKGNVVLSVPIVNKKQKKNDSKITGLYSIYSDGLTVSDQRPEGGKIALIKKDGSAKWYKADDYYWYTQDLLATAVYKNGEALWGYVDKSFQTKIALQYEAVRPFNQNLAPVKEKDKWGFIDKKGKMVIKAQFEDFGVQDSLKSYQVFSDGLAAVQKNGKWGAIDKKGKTVIDFQYSAPFFFSNGYAYVADKKGNYNYIDKKGKMTIKDGFQDANFFTKSGVALVERKGVYQLIDKKGKKVGEKTWKFDRTLVNVLSPDIAYYQIDGYWGVAKIK